MKTLKPFILPFFLLATSMAMAQGATWGKHEIHVGYGVGTVQEISTFFASSLMGANVDGGSGNGALCFGYRYHSSSRWAIGASGVVENIDITFQNSTTKQRWKTYAAMLDAQYYYVQKPLLQLYSGLYAGYANFKTSDGATNSSDAVAFHVSALGLRLGSTIGVFGEVGFGYRGIFNLGVSARL